MDLEELRCFLAVVEEGSILGASTRLGVPRGTLRRRIDELEARAGVPLLERSARGVAVTDPGTLLVRRGRDLLERGTALLMAVRERGREPTGTLRLHMPLGLAPELLSAVADLVRVGTPGLQLSLHMCEEPRTVPLGDTDLVIHFGERISSDQWQVTQLATIPVRVVASPQYLERSGRPRTVADLSGHRLLSWTNIDHPADRWPLHAGGSVAVAPALSSNDAHAMRMQARAHAGLVLLPDAALDLVGLPVDDLVPVLDDQIGRPLPVQVSAPAVIAESPRIARMAALLQSFVANMTPGALIPDKAPE